MNPIRTTARVGPDGTVVVLVGVAESGRMVDVTVTPVPEPGTINGLPADKWWELFNRTAGSIDDPAFERPPQEPYEPRSIGET